MDLSTLEMCELTVMLLLEVFLWVLQMKQKYKAALWANQEAWNSEQ